MFILCIHVHLFTSNNRFSYLVKISFCLHTIHFSQPYLNLIFYRQYTLKCTIHLLLCYLSQLQPFTTSQILHLSSFLPTIAFSRGLSLQKQQHHRHHHGHILRRSTQQFRGEWQFRASICHSSTHCNCRHCATSASVSSHSFSLRIPHITVYVVRCFSFILPACDGCHDDVFALFKSTENASNSSEK